MDEKGYAMEMIGKARVIVSKHERVAYMMQDGSRESVTLLECVAMDGDMIGVQFIFKGKLKTEEWARHLKSKDMDIEVSDSGWTDNEIGLKWFKKIFEPQSRQRLENKDKYRLLFLDGHLSHISREVIFFCEQHKIILLCLPAHSTHILQPLDVGIFGPLAAKYKQLLENRSWPGGRYFIDKVEFLDIYQDARDQVFSPSLVQSAFRKAGYAPFDPQTVLDNLPCARLNAHIESKQITGVEVPSFNRPITRTYMPVLSLEDSRFRTQYCLPTPANVGEIDLLLERRLDREGNVDPITIKLAQGLKHKLVECEVKKNKNAVIMAAFRQ